MGGMYVASLLGLSTSHRLGGASVVCPRAYERACEALRDVSVGHLRGAYWLLTGGDLDDDYTEAAVYAMDAYEGSHRMMHRRYVGWLEFNAHCDAMSELADELARLGM